MLESLIHYKFRRTFALAVIVITVASLPPKVRRSG
jgi:hypothetical protein